MTGVGPKSAPLSCKKDASRSTGCPIIVINHIHINEFLILFLFQPIMQFFPAHQVSACALAPVHATLTTPAVIKAATRLIAMNNKVNSQPKYATITGRRTGLMERQPIKLAT